MKFFRLKEEISQLFLAFTNHPVEGSARITSFEEQLPKQIFVLLSSCMHTSLRMHTPLNLPRSAYPLTISLSPRTHGEVIVKS